MKATPLALSGLVLFEPRVFPDARGCFFESFNQKAFTEATGFDGIFVQDNHSVSHKGVLRGMHYQLPPHAQGKLVRVTKGAVFDAVVDIRRASPTFGQWYGDTLSAENKKILWIPPGFAHGFLALTDDAEFTYKVADIYAPETARIIACNDPAIGIQWPLAEHGIDAPLLAPQDAAAPTLSAAETFA